MWLGEENPKIYFSITSRLYIETNQGPLESRTLYCKLNRSSKIDTKAIKRNNVLESPKVEPKVITKVEHAINMYILRVNTPLPHRSISAAHESADYNLEPPHRWTNRVLLEGLINPDTSNIDIRTFSLSMITFAGVCNHGTLFHTQMSVILEKTYAIVVFYYF